MYIGPGSVFTKYSQEHSRFYDIECNTTSEWLNRWFSQSEVVLHSNAAKCRNIWRIRLRTFLRMIGEYRPSSPKVFPVNLEKS